MNRLHDMSDSPKPGNPDEWNRMWEDSETQLFVRSTPKSVIQLCQRGYFEDLWSFLKDTPQPVHCLELGSGRGTTSMYLSSCGCRITMVDLATEAFHLAEINFKGEGLNLPTLITADVRNTGLPGNSFDCVYNIGVLEHFEDPRPVLMEAIRLLKPGGLLFMVIVPSIPLTRRWLSYLLLAPWHLVWQPGKALLKKLLGRTRRSSMTRTFFSNEQWISWLDETKVTDCSCVWYNPYHQITSSKLMEQSVVVPAYLLHYSRTRSRPDKTTLQTWGSIAACQLLTGRKS